MIYYRLFDIEPGVTAIIGSGGKTSLLRRLAEEVPGTAILCTTAHIRPFSEYPVLESPDPDAVRQALTAHRIICVGTPCENGKLTAPALPMEALAELADYVLAEADGSRQLPLKAHAAHEPVIPASSRRIVCVAGASGFGKPIRTAVHRPERFCALTGARETDTATPELAARVFLAEHLCGTVFLNQLDTPDSTAAGWRFAAPLTAAGIQVWGGCLHTGRIFPLF